jgi:hypothetical protein
MNRRLVRLVLNLSSAVMAVFGAADLILWFTVGAMIPSWTMTAMAAGSTTLIQIIKEKVIE